MGLFSKKDKEDDASFHSDTATPPTTAERTMDTTEKGMEDDGPTHIYNFKVIAMVLIVSLGGMIFGYDTGQVISKAANLDRNLLIEVLHSRSLVS